jgi:hypothetical protein
MPAFRSPPPLDTRRNASSHLGCLFSCCVLVEAQHCRCLCDGGIIWWVCEAPHREGAKVEVEEAKVEVEEACHREGAKVEVEEACAGVAGGPIQGGHQVLHASTGPRREVCPHPTELCLAGGCCQSCCWKPCCCFLFDLSKSKVLFDLVVASSLTGLPQRVPLPSVGAPSSSPIAGICLNPCAPRAIHTCQHTHTHTRHLLDL